MFRPTYLALAMALLVANCAISQSKETLKTNKVTLNNAVVGSMVFLGQTQAYSEWNPSQSFSNPIVRNNQGVLVPHEELENKGLHLPKNPNALPLGLDPALQQDFGTRGMANRGLDLSIDGMPNSGVSPADPCLDVGPNHVIEMMNGSSGAYFQIFDKQGNALGTQVYLDNFTGSVGGLGDPIVLYDALADRWLMSEFSASGNQLLVAISTTPDPTGTWNAYSFTAPNFPDYPKYSVWTDMYMVTSNEGTGCPIYALDRTKMLAGDNTATFQRFTTPDYPTIGFQATTPITFDNGTAPPAGSPATLMRMADDAWDTSIPADRLEIWELAVDFATPANSVLSGPDYLLTDPFDTELCGYTSFSCIEQPGSNTSLDPLREVIMNRAQYRNFGAYEAIVCNHVTDIDGTDHAGVRWYELRRTGGPTQPWSIYQQGTYAPDGDSRWMAGIGINASGDIGLAYSVSSDATAPSLRFTGRNSTDPLGTMTFTETSIVEGTVANSSNRWGDYFSLDSDPTTGSFWGVGCYNATSSWGTRIFEFSLPPSAPDYQIELATTSATSCVPNSVSYAINVSAVLGYNDPVTFSVANLPSGLSASFSSNPVSPGSSTTLTVSHVGNVVTGSFMFDLAATSTSGNKNNSLTINLSETPGALIQRSPTDGATGVAGAVLRWDKDPLADSYDIEIAADAGFNTIIENVTGITDTAHVPTIANQPTTTYYWRARTVNTCGTTSYSPIWSYTTSACQAVTVSIILDRYGAETTWSVEDVNGTTYANGGPYTTTTTNGEYPQPSVSLCLPDGCYTLTVNDSFGDGICCAYGNGAIAILDAGSNELASASSFAASAIEAFTIGSQSCTSVANYSEDFEATTPCFAVWNNVTGDDFDWTLNSGSTASTGTGPSGDHTTGSGNYFYTETSAPVAFSDVALLESSCLDLAGYTSIDVSFWYHMLGPNMGSLELQALEGTTWTSYWSLAGDQGDVWNQATINIPTVNGLSQLRFRAEVGTAGESYQNDFAIDDIAISNGTSDVLLAASVFLEGPFDTGTGLMKDDIRVANLIPLEEPYTASGYTFIGGGGETMDANVLSITGNDAIVDWVIIELRSATDNTLVVHSRAALLQRDGDVVDVDGVSDVELSVNPGDYFVALRHRNHLGSMATPATSLNGSASTVDFTDPNTSVFGVDARMVSGAVALLWSGNVVFDGSILYTGAGNDRDPILSKIGGSIPTATVSEYTAEDINLDGVVKYTGTENDRDPILVNIGAIPTAARVEQLP